MTKIKIINPDCGMSKQDLWERESYLNQVTRPDTTISMISTSKNNIYIDSVVDEALATPELIELGMNAYKEGFEAIGMYCFSDPALEALRECLPIPVIGAGQSAMHLGALLGDQISVVTTSKDRVAPKMMTIDQLGVNRNHIASIRGIEQVVSDDATMLNQLKQVIKQCIDTDGAQVIVLGCLTYVKYADELNQLFKVPIINPSFALINTIEMVTNQGISHSKIAFPTPTKKNRQWSAGETKLGRMLK